MKRSLMVVSFALLFLCFFFDQSHSGVLAATIECEFESYDWKYASEIDLYTCEVTNKNIFNDGERVNIDGVKGQHKAGKSYEDVQGIEIIDAPNMNKFPAGLATIFPNLICIYVPNSKLSEIASEDLREFSQLKYFWIDYNQLTHIRENLFEHNKYLEVLGLSSNRIVHVDTNALTGLGKLRVLNFKENPCDLGKAETRTEVETIMKRIEAGECQSDEVKIQLLQAEVETMTAKMKEKDVKIMTLKIEKQAMQAKLNLKEKLSKAREQESSRRFNNFIVVINQLMALAKSCEEQATAPASPEYDCEYENE